MIKSKITGRILILTCLILAIGICSNCHIAAGTEKIEEEEDKQPVLALKPPFIFIGILPKEKSYSGKAKLKGTIVENGNLSNLTIKKSSPSIEAVLKKKKVKNKTVIFLEFILLKEMQAGSFNESITVVSKDPLAYAEIVLIGQKLGDIKVNPDRLEFILNNENEADVRSILLESKKPFNITKVEDISGFLDISIKTVEEGKIYKLMAKLKRPVSETFIGLVKVYTDFKEQPLIDIPVIGLTN